MSLEAGIYKLVSEYYEARILYGYYKCGEKLPSIPKICAVFHMAPATVRTGLADLEKQGYIRVDARKSAKVIFKSDPAERRKRADEYFVPRRKGIQDLLESIEFLFGPLWKLGMRQLREEDWDDFRAISEQNSGNTVAVPIYFYLLALRALDNSLILNFYWEVLRFLRFPYLIRDEEWSIPSNDFRGKSKAEIAAMLTRHYKHSFQESVKKLFDFIDEAVEESAVQQPETVPFRWYIYRQRPQLCYTLVCSVIKEIAKNTYEPGSFLPSLPKMAESYGVSVSTVRRSINILNSAGLTESFQGKGTQVQLKIGQIDFERPEIRDGMRLYLESLKFLKLTIKEILMTTFCFAEENKKNWMKESFYELINERKSYACFELCFVFIEQECPMEGVKEYCRKISELAVWGYPFTLYRLRDKLLQEEYCSIMDRAAECLRRENFSAFAECFELWFEQEEKKMSKTFGMEDI